jgi:uncharacterized SAM-binding protein YcdF (DUF218 family)
LVVESDLSLFLSKLLPVIIYPVGIASVLTLFGGLLATLGYSRSAATCAISAGLLLWTCSTPIVAEWLVNTLERQYPARTLPATPTAEVAIVLGGGLRPASPPRLVADFGDASDRIVHAARLYRARKVKRVLVTGGSIPWNQGVAPEAELIRNILVEFGVPEAAIAFAGESRNTYENALEITKLRAITPFDTALLVTSALHMPRAMATFQKAGIPVVASSTDVRVIYKAERLVFDWLPDSESLDLTTKALKEWMGHVSYAVRGYL